MQIHLAKVGMESEVAQAQILMKNIEPKIDFSKAHLLSEDENYLQEFSSRLEITDEIIENVVKMRHLEKISNKEEKLLGDLVENVSERGLKFRLASLLGLKSHLKRMLNDKSSYYYLLDSKYGSVDIFLINKDEFNNKNISFFILNKHFASFLH